MRKGRLSLVGELCTDIADVPEFAAACGTVFLSNNCLRSLAGVEVFEHVVQLSLANNCVDSLAGLAPLAALETLEVLALEGNAAAGAGTWCLQYALRPLPERPVDISVPAQAAAALPGYRARVVASCPALRRLDGRDVTRNERSTAAAAMERIGPAAPR